MRNRYTKQIEKASKERTAQEWREDLVLVAALLLAALIIVV